MICLPSTLPSREGGPLHRATFHQPLGTLRAPAGPGFRQADQDLSHFHKTVDASLRLLEQGLQPWARSSRTSAKFPLRRARPVSPRR